MITKNDNKYDNMITKIDNNGGGGGGGVTINGNVMLRTYVLTY